MSKLSNPRPWWFWFWMVWLGVFVVAEGIAIFGCRGTGGGCSLSESVWFLQRGFWPLTILLAILLLFLVWHFIVDRRSRRHTRDRTKRVSE